MDEFELIGEPRSSQGKAATRRLRRQGLVPGIIYGGDKDPVSAVFKDNEVRKRIANEAFFSHIIKVGVGADTTDAVVKDMQRDPATDQVIHMDFQRVSATQELHMSVPLHFVNEEECVGRKAGGVISPLMVDVEIGCLPKDLPEYIEVDVAALDIGDSVMLSEVVVPEGVKLMAFVHDPEGDHDQMVVSVHMPHIEVEEDEDLETDEDGEGMEAPEGEGEGDDDEEEAKD